MQTSAQRAIGSSVAPGIVASRTNAPHTTRKQPAAEASYVAAPGARERRSSRLRIRLPGARDLRAAHLAGRPESGSRPANDRPAKRPRKGDGQRIGPPCVEGVAGRSGALRCAADGSDGTRTRGLRRDRARLSRAKSLQTRGLGAVAVTFPSPFCGPQPAAARRKRPHPDWWPVSIQDAIDVIVLRRSDRLITAVRVHGRRRSQTRIITP